MGEYQKKSLLRLATSLLSSSLFCATSRGTPDAFTTSAKANKDDDDDDADADAADDEAAADDKTRHWPRAHRKRKGDAH